MKLLFFDDFKLGVLKDRRVVDVTGALGDAASLPPEYQMEHVIAEFDSLKPRLEEAAQGQGRPVSEVKVRPPLPRPHNTLCAFANYKDRPDAKPWGPLDFFYKGSTCIVGDNDTVEVPDIEGAVAYQPEAEFAYVIGRRAKKVQEAEALDYVFGYVNFVDVSARGVPKRWTTFLTKGLDGWAPIGPVITTKDEIPDPQNVRVRLWLNGELQQDYSTSLMAHSIRAQIAWLTQYITLMPGDVISCGTHHGGLCNINDGDKVEIEADGLERLTFNVRSYAPRLDEPWRPPGLSA